MKYVVVEIQNGAIGSNSWTYEDYNQAESKYHSILSVAAVSDVASHAAAILDEFAFCIEYKGYNHATSMT